MEESGIVSCEFNGNLGNICLEIYKVFKFCQLKGVDFSKIKLNGDYQDIKSRPFFANLKKYMVPESEWRQLAFSERHCNDSNISNIRYSSRKNKLFTHWNWLYPHTLEECKLFNMLFDNKDFMEEVFHKRKSLFDQMRPVVGATARRGDFLLYSGRRACTEELLAKVLLDIKRRYKGLSKTIVTSDDPDWCKATLKKIGNKDAKVIDDASPDEQIAILSMCDVIVNNGSWYTGDEVGKDKLHESTFGQIAQCLALSRKHLDDE